MRRPELPVAVVAAAALVAGCGGGGSTSGGSSSSNSASAGNATSTEHSTTSPATSSTASTHSTSTSAATATGGLTTHAAKPPKPRRPSPATPAATVDAALTSPRCDLYTARLLQKSYGGLAGCEAALESGGSASSVEIQRTQPEGKFALVVAVPRGGPSSGEKLAVSLIKENGDWRLEAIHSNVKVGP
jgi:hypothetical protein